MNYQSSCDNAMLRYNAARLTRRHLWLLTGMFVLYTLITQLWSIALSRGLVYLLKPSLTEAARQAAAANASQQLAFIRFMLSPVCLAGMAVSMILYLMVSAPLALGLQTQFLEAAREQEVQLWGVFSRWRSTLKALGLALWTALLILLWALSGTLVALAGYGVAVSFGAEAGDLVTLCGSGLSIGLCAMAMLRYAQAAWILADEPSRGVRECVRLSVILMKGRKWQYVRLLIPIVLCALGVLFGMVLLMSIFCVLIGMSVEDPAVDWMTYLLFIPVLYFVLKGWMASALFYDGLRKAACARDDRSSFWLQDRPAEAVTPFVPESQPQGPDGSGPDKGAPQA